MTEKKKNNSLYLTGCALAAGMAFMFEIFTLDGMQFESFAGLLWFLVFVFGTAFLSWFSVGALSIAALLMIVEKLSEIAEVL